MAIIPVFPKNQQNPLIPLSQASQVSNQRIDSNKLPGMLTPAGIGIPASHPILASIDALHQELTGLHPNLPSLLSQILDQLKASPGVVTILTPEQIGIIIKALQAQTNTAIIAVATKAKKPKGNLLDLI